MLRMLYVHPLSMCVCVCVCAHSSVTQLLQQVETLCIKTCRPLLPVACRVPVLQMQLPAAPLPAAAVPAPAAAEAAPFGMLPAAPVWLPPGALPAAALPSSIGLHISQPKGAATAGLKTTGPPASTEVQAAAWGAQPAQQQLIGAAARSAQLQPAVGGAAAAGALSVQLADAYVDDPDIQDLLRQILEDTAEDGPAAAAAAAGAAPALADTCKVAAGVPVALRAADAGAGGFAAPGAIAGAAVAVHVSAGGSAGAGNAASAPAAAEAGATEAAGQDGSTNSFLQHLLGLQLYRPGMIKRGGSGLMLADQAPAPLQWPVPRVDLCAEPGLLSSLSLSSAVVSVSSRKGFGSSRQWQDDWQLLGAVYESSSEGVVRGLVPPSSLPAGGPGALPELLLTDITVSGSSAAAATAAASAAAAGPHTPASRAKMAGLAGTVGWQLVVEACLVQLFVPLGCLQPRGWLPFGFLAAGCSWCWDNGSAEGFCSSCSCC